MWVPVSPPLAPQYPGLLTHSSIQRAWSLRLCAGFWAFRTVACSSKCNGGCSHANTLPDRGWTNQKRGWHPRGKLHLGGEAGPGAQGRRSLLKIAKKREECFRPERERLFWKPQLFSCGILPQVAHPWCDLINFPAYPGYGASAVWLWWLPGPLCVA